MPPSSLEEKHPKNAIIIGGGAKNRESGTGTVAINEGQLEQKLGPAVAAAIRSAAENIILVLDGTLDLVTRTRRASTVKRSQVKSSEIK